MSASMSSRRSVMQEKVATREDSCDINFLISFSVFLVGVVLTAIAYKTSNVPLAVPSIMAVAAPVIYWLTSRNAGLAPRRK